MMDQTDAPISVRPADAVRLLGISRTVLFRELAAGRIASTKVGRVRLIPTASLRAWLGARMASEAETV